jgi:hypothetical protein
MTTSHSPAAIRITTLTDEHAAQVLDIYPPPATPRSRPSHPNGPGSLPPG